MIKIPDNLINGTLLNAILLGFALADREMDKMFFAKYCQDEDIRDNYNEHPAAPS